MSIADRVRIKDVELLSKRRYELKSATFDYRRSNGEWQTQAREVYDRGNGATLLPYNLKTRSVVLVRQFRYPAFANGYDDLLIEAAAGMLDDAAPEARIRAEAEEEIGYRLTHVRKVFEAFMTPGAVTEKLHFFVAEYDAAMRVGDGGGLADEGEDIEVLELSIDDALAMISDGRIVDGQDHHAAAIRRAASVQVGAAAVSRRGRRQISRNNPMQRSRRRPALDLTRRATHGYISNIQKSCSCAPAPGGTWHCDGRANVHSTARSPGMRRASNPTTRKLATTPTRLANRNFHCGATVQSCIARVTAMSTGACRT
ncbi:nudix-type nucleoside diphosphatase (YffH/AdpP family) [Bradyrhizobium sp. USDA 4451]